MTEIGTCWPAMWSVTQQLIQWGAVIVILFGMPFSPKVKLWLKEMFKR